MIKLFISQPMRGKTDEEILKGNPLEFMARSIALLGKADVAYFAKGWEQARGPAAALKTNARLTMALP